MGFRDIQKLLTPPPPDVKPGGLDPRAQDMVRQRLAEGASPEQIKMEMLGPPPGPEEMQPEGAANG
jgi:hypothetical protein